MEKGPKVIWDFPRAEVLLKSDPEHITGVDIIAERQQVESCRRGTSRADRCLSMLGSHLGPGTRQGTKAGGGFRYPTSHRYFAAREPTSRYVYRYQLHLKFKSDNLDCLKATLLLASKSGLMDLPIRLTELSQCQLNAAVEAGKDVKR